MVLLSVAVCFAALPDSPTRMSGGTAIVLAVLGLVVGMTAWMLVRPRMHSACLARVMGLSKARVSARDAAPTPPG